MLVFRLLRGSYVVPEVRFRMANADKEKLTVKRIQKFPAPEKGEAFLWDPTMPGFGVRCFPSGRKVYILMYRVVGGGRGATRKRVTIGDVNKLSVDDARKRALQLNGQIAAGADPRAKVRDDKRRSAAMLEPALAAYESHLIKHSIKNRAQCISSLKRGLLQHLGNIDLQTIDRRSVVELVEKMEAKGRRKVAAAGYASGKADRIVGGPAAASQLRAYAHAFFSWSANQGLIPTNPIGGWRRQRQSKAERIKQSGRAISDQEIKAVWAACGGVQPPYGDFIRTLLLTGQRRSETSLMRWSNVDFTSGVWDIPREDTKNGRAHRVPLPQVLIDILKSQPRFAGSDFVFAGRGGVAISGWSKRQAALIEASGVDFKLHDLRKTFRSGLTRLGADLPLAEMMLNHKRETLVEIYDHEPRWSERDDLASRWADHVLACVRTFSAAMVQMPDKVVKLEQHRAAGRRT